VDLVKKHEYFKGLKIEFPNLPDDLIEMCVGAFMKQPKTFVELHKKDLKEQKEQRHRGAAGGARCDGRLSAAKLEELNARFLAEQALVVNKAWVELAPATTGDGDTPTIKSVSEE
jgi:hypothetical protein